jgi:hypothetical protein
MNKTIQQRIRIYFLGLELFCYTIQGSITTILNEFQEKGNDNFSVVGYPRMVVTVVVVVHSHYTRLGFFSNVFV